MKKIFLIIFIFSFIQLYSQEDCKIFPGDSTICAGTHFQLWTRFEDTLNYYWQPSGETSPLIEMEINDTTLITLVVYNDDSTWVCNDTVTIAVYPKVVIELDQQNMGCFYECKTQVKASASGGFPPYRYQWFAKVAPNDSTLALGLCSEEKTTLIVYDTICSYDTAYLVEAFKMPEVELAMDPEDDVYDINPEVTFSFDNLSADTLPLSNWVWIFEDGSSTSNEFSPTHVFSRSDTVEFVYTTIDGCDSTLYIEVAIDTFHYQVEQYVITPNGDGFNDVFRLDTLKNYVSNEIVIFNRWGQKLFEQTDFDKWDGGKQPDGVYFFIVKAYGYFREDTFRGTLTILASPY